MMLQCEECDVWRLLYSQKKLTYREHTQLEEALSDFTFTCGALLQDLDLPGKLADVYVRDIVCGEPVEKLYYSAKYPPICVYCATPGDPNTESDHYPQCTDSSGVKNDGIASPIEHHMQLEITGQQMGHGMPNNGNGSWNIHPDCLFVFK